MSNQSDEELLVKIKADDKAAFRQIFDRYYKYLVVTVNNVSGDDQMAHDIAQDVFLIIWKKRKDLTINNLKSYLRRAALNKMLNRIKANRMNFHANADLPENVSEYSEPLENLKANNLQEAVNRAMNELPERCRMVFKLRRVEQYSLKEIAAELGISPKTVENQLTKAMKFMRIRLKDFLIWGVPFGIWNLFF